MIGNKKTLPAGFSLIEVLVSVSLFVFIIMSATEIFSLVIKGQRDAIASQNVQSSLRYFFEVTSKEIRMARRSTGECGVPADDIYKIETGTLSSILKFKNYYNQCVVYELGVDDYSQRFKITRGVVSGFISPKKIKIESLDFLLDDTNQPAVTIALKASAIGDSKFKSEMDIQTTITSRYYK